MATKSGKKNNSYKNGELEESVEDEILKEKDKIKSILFKKINIKAKNQNQKDLIKSIKDNQITIVSGPAGTGKTFLSLTTALDSLIDRNNRFKRIVLVKSVKTLPGEELGYLKGTLEDKTTPFLWSFLWNLEKVLPENKIKKIVDEEIIRVIPLAYFRGLTIDNSIILIDEVQNISHDILKSIMSRIGENSKMIIMGDENQIDLKNKKDSSLNFAINAFKDIEDIGIIKFNSNEIVRNPIISKILEVFDKNYNPETDSYVTINVKN